MKANELFVGAWITSKKWREKPFKITRINDSGKYYCGITAEGSQVGPFLIEELEPIPLTAEILEKNGFEANRRLEGEYTIADDYYDIIISLWSDSIWEFYYSSCEFNIPDTKLLFSFVHQLQHALRLCGIEKSIEL